MNRYWMTVCAAGLAAAVAVYAQDSQPAEAPKPAADAKFETLKSKASYGVGMNIGMNLLRQGFNIDELGLDLELVAEGLKDALAQRDPQLNEEQLMTAMDEFQKGLAARQEEREAMSKKAGEEFLAANAKKEGVKTTASGLQYEVLKKGAGASPKATDKVTVHYKGTLINGEEFDSSHRRGEPVSFVLDEVIRGWTEGVQLMNVGSKYRFFIPYELGYGERGAPPRIPPHSVLIFEVELLGVDKP
jgi:FKBP-type peptidyl-prolyl cis-trans isomerase